MYKIPTIAMIGHGGHYGQWSNNTVGILQYKPIQSAKYCNLIGQLRATELDYIVKCPQCNLG